jgi:hypothetical protein
MVVNVKIKSGFYKRLSSIGMKMSATASLIQLTLAPWAPQVLLLDWTAKVARNIDDNRLGSNPSVLGRSCCACQPQSLGGN